MVNFSKLEKLAFFRYFLLKTLKNKILRFIFLKEKFLDL